MYGEGKNRKNQMLRRKDETNTNKMLIVLKGNSLKFLHFNSENIPHLENQFKSILLKFKFILYDIK